MTYLSHDNTDLRAPLVTRSNIVLFSFSLLFRYISLETGLAVNIFLTLLTVTLISVVLLICSFLQIISIENCVCYTHYFRADIEGKYNPNIWPYVNNFCCFQCMKYLTILNSLHNYIKMEHVLVNQFEFSSVGEDF